MMYFTRFPCFMCFNLSSIMQLFLFFLHSTITISTPSLTTYHQNNSLSTTHQVQFSKRGIDQTPALVDYSRIKHHPFPFLTVWDKAGMDPELDWSWRIGLSTGINNYFRSPTGSVVTYFIPTNRSWKRIFEQRTLPLSLQRSIISRHLILSDSPFTMERLVRLTSESSDGLYPLPTIAGVVQIGVIHFDGEYFLHFNDSFMLVRRGDYLCQDGVVHVFDGVFIYEEELIGDEEEKIGGENGGNNEKEGKGFWGFLKYIITG